MACLKDVRPFVALVSVALGLWLPVSLPAQTQNIPTKAKVPQQKAPAGAQLKVPLQQVLVPLRLTIAPSSYTPAVNDKVHIEATWNRKASIVSYLFNWGDSPPTVEVEPQWDHTYQQPGDYKVMVTVKVLVNDREFDVPSNELIIRVQPAPQPQELPKPVLTANPVSVRLGEPITFTATIDSSVGPPQYDFFFDDNTHQPSDSNEFVYTYRLPGTFHPYVVAVLGHGDASVTGGAIDVTVVVPSLTASVLTKEPTAGQSVLVCAELDTPSKDVHYEFAWGDQSGPEPGDVKGCAQHIYASATSYTVQVRGWVTGAENYPAVTPLTIIVNEAASGQTPPGPANRRQDGGPPPPPAFPWGPIAVIVVVVGAGAAIGWKILHGGKTPVRPTTDLHVTGYPGEVSNEIKSPKQDRLYVSVTLVPGMEPGEHRITFL